MKKNIRTLKYLLGGAFWLIALYILFLVVTGMLNPYCVFTAKNIVFDLTLIGGCSLVGSLFFCSTQKSSQPKYRIMQYYMTLIALAYLLGLIIVLLSTSALMRFNGEMQRSYDYNLIPFKTILDFIHKATHHEINLDIVISNLIGNVIMFMPMAFFLPILFGNRNSYKRYFLISLGIIISVELMQLLLGTGSLDIDDVILNSLGVILGIMLYRLKFIQFVLKKLYIIHNE